MAEAVWFFVYYYGSIERTLGTRKAKKKAWKVITFKAKTTTTTIENFTFTKRQTWKDYSDLR